MRLKPNNSRMTEAEADLEVDRRDAHWRSQGCPVLNDLCRVDCHSYNDAYKKMTGSGHKDKKDWQVKDGYCSSPLVTGTIEHEGCWHMKGEGL